MKITKLLLAALGVAVITSCDRFDINRNADRRLSEMKSPVILIGKRENQFGYCVTLKDSVGRVESFGNATMLGLNIGESRHIGDTIK